MWVILSDGLLEMVPLKSIKKMRGALKSIEPAIERKTERV